MFNEYIFDAVYNDEYYEEEVETRESLLRELKYEKENLRKEVEEFERRNSIDPYAEGWRDEVPNDILVTRERIKELRDLLKTLK